MTQHRGEGFGEVLVFDDEARLLHAYRRAGDDRDGLDANIIEMMHAMLGDNSSPKVVDDGGRSGDSVSPGCAPTMNTAG